MSDGQANILSILSKKMEENKLESISNIYFYGEITCSIKFTRYNGEKVEIEFSDKKKMYDYIVSL